MVAVQDHLKKEEIDVSLAEIFTGETSKKRFAFSAKMMHSGLTFLDKNKVKINNYADYSYFALC